MTTIGMSDEFTTFAQRAVIKVCGVGGGGGNAVNRMIAAGLREVEFIVVNTDAQALQNSPAPRRLQIGLETTHGLGAGAKPDIGRAAAIEDRDRLSEALKGADMVFLTAGLGGGTGTGAGPVVAEIAKGTGALVVAIVTLPFSFEGIERMENAREGLKLLEEQVNSLIVVPNDRVAALGQNKISFLNAFQQADEVLHNGVRAITDLITVHGLINVDFADVRTVMEIGGRALMGIGVAEGENRAVRAAQEAIVCPLLEQSNIQGARGVIVNVTGGRDIGMREMEEAVSTVRKAAHPKARIIFGAVVSEEERPELQVMVIAAGFDPDMASEYSDQGLVSAAETPVAAPVEPPVFAPAPAKPVLPPEPAPVKPGTQIEFAVNNKDTVEAGVSTTVWAGNEPEPEPAVQRSGGSQDDDMNLPTWLRKRLKK
ncbi:MAG TPA: cell division protein FtsZ [Candidatus Hydrogenedentes bacterium]|nr:cell division protein FtsZ [Candidatus Hydrogenedentota bacterium]HPC17351.1 cell division protein FtsZ [Candidatus Hydrogenedentota bacterium]HRT20085.1 cell division protein FtsZ [Candidatus Hydrogenedentota bacterium]HRT64851.1 cell division protein FtsZ [Candidatus Hydrogenedentota bacterium]